MSFEKIAVGIDLTAESELAAQQAMSLARRDGASLVLIHAGPMRDDDRARVEALRTRLGGHGVEVSSLLVGGAPEEALPGAAHDLGCDLIAVGTHGRMGIARFFGGSIAEATVRRAASSVLVARGDVAAAEGGFHRIVIGADFSPLSEVAIARALVLAAPGADVRLVHAWSVRPVATPDGLVTGEAVRDAMCDEAEARGRALLERVREAHPGVALSLDTCEAPAQEALIDRARELGADLIAVGSHGRRGVKRLVLGSVAEVVVRHAPCTVLVARDGAAS
jgi:nucleotide-binding universal stress UspA family protein